VNREGQGFDQLSCGNLKDHEILFVVPPPFVLRILVHGNIQIWMCDRTTSG
jgi:hypothetical protein